MPRSSFPRPLVRRGAAAALATALALTGLVVLPAAVAAAADPATPIPPAPASAVSADSLPTVQIDGVVWSQAVSGTTVYAAGAFGTARPAGAAPGVNTVPRRNLLSYDITTGVVRNFTPSLNAAALVVVASPDGRRIYVGGNFTTADGLSRQHIAAYDTTSGQIVQSFAPSVDALVSSMYVTDTTLYVGGSFTVANGAGRSRLAAFNVADGGLLGWAPSADGRVDAMVLTPDRSKLIVGGRFTSLNGAAVRGLQAVDPANGSTVAGWSANGVVRNGGLNAGITSLSTDGTNVYGTGFVYDPAMGNLEGAFSADAASGAINWIEDCHGDTYSSFPVGGALYTAGHAHSCDNINGFAEQPTRAWWYAQAFTTAATGTIHRNSVNLPGYADWGGYRSPSPLSWYPALEQGKASGQGQAAWSVNGNAQYVVYGGEFPTVNSVGQQGLARFAVRAAAPLAVGPAANTLLKPSVTSTSPNTARVAWQTTWDRDDRNLTYKVFRNGDLTTPVHTVTADSTFWNKPWLTWTDTAVTAGTSYSYRVFAYDPAGNATSGGTTTAVAGSVDTSNAYVNQVRADGAGILWRLDESTGSTAYDAISGYDAVVGTGVGRGASGPGPSGAAGTATAGSFAGNDTSSVASQYTMYGPRVFTVSARFRTTSTTGGELVGFGTSKTGLSVTNDRALYLTSNGRVYFDVFAGAHRSVSTTGSYNDGRWHVVTATMSTTTMTLYVDGTAVAARSDGVYPWFQNGSWRIGGDKLTGMTNAPANNYFTGSIADVAVYPTALTAAQVGNQARLATAVAAAAAPAAAPATTQAPAENQAPAATQAPAVTQAPPVTTAATPGQVSTPAPDTTPAPAVTTADLAAGRAAATTAAGTAPTAVFAGTATGSTAALEAAGSTDADGRVTGYAWDFGDGSTQARSAVSAASHTYAVPGIYQVTLTVTDSDGLTGAATGVVTVPGPDVPATATAADGPPA